MQENRDVLVRVLAHQRCDPALTLASVGCLGRPLNWERYAITFGQADGSIAPLSWGQPSQEPSAVHEAGRMNGLEMMMADESSSKGIEAKGLFRQLFQKPHRIPGADHQPISFDGEGCWWNDPQATPLAAGRGFNIQAVGESQFQKEIGSGKQNQQSARGIPALRAGQASPSAA